MITEQPDIDLTTLADRFTTNDDYTKEVILKELQYWQTQPDFLCVTSGEAFLIAYRNRSSLWIAQVYSKEGLMVGREAITYAREWAKARGMTSITFETTRKQVKAMSRYGATEYSVIMREQLC
jgi:hypothetical protein